MQLAKISTLFFLCLILLLGCSSSEDGDNNNNSQNYVLTSNAGTDLTAEGGETVNLDGSGSANSNTSIAIVSYSWTQTTGPTVNLQNSDTATPSFVAPVVSVTTEIIFELTVTDANGNTDTDNIKVTIAPQPTNQQPLANAGDDQSVNSNESVTLDGKSSSDPDTGDSIAIFSWTQTAGPNVPLLNDDTAVASFTAPAVTTQTVLSFELTVTDTNGATGYDSVDIMVAPAVPLAGPYVFFNSSVGLSSSNGLKVVDTHDSNSIITIETDVVEHIILTHDYDFDSATQLISDYKPAYIFYFKNNHFWRVYLGQNSDLTPQQVSSESIASICEVVSTTDPLNILDKAIIYTTPGADGNCIGTDSDNEIRVIRLGFNANELPLDATALFPSLRYPITLENGFLTMVEGVITQYDENLQNPVQLLTADNPGSVLFRLMGAGSNYAFVQVDGEIRVIDGVSKTITSPLHTISSLGMPNFQCDASDCFFIDRTATANASLFKMPKDGSGTSQIILQEVGPNDPQPEFRIVRITTGYVFYYMQNISGTMDLYRFPKSPTNFDAPIIIDNADDFSKFYASSESVYYEKLEKSGNTVVNYTAVSIDQDLINRQVFNQSQWIGLADFSMYVEDFSFDGNQLLANGYTSIDSGIGGATLQEYDTKTGALISIVGEIPINIFNLVDIVFTKYGNLFFATGKLVSPTASGYQQDVFVVNPDANPVFTNLTNTPALDEYVLQ